MGSVKNDEIRKNELCYASILRQKRGVFCKKKGGVFLTELTLGGVGWWWVNED